VQCVCLVCIWTCVCVYACICVRLDVVCVVCVVCVVYVFDMYMDVYMGVSVYDEM
jgi:hypothetical protein